MLKIYTVLCRAGVMDNYSYILVDEASGISAVLDPSEAGPIVAKCAELGIKLAYVLNTHHHFDHTDANLEIKEMYGAKVVGNEADAKRIPGFDLGVIDGGEFWLGQTRAQIIDVSAHTQGHILWYFAEDKALFTGDTLFNLTIGGLFEGTEEQMFAALQKIKQLPDEVKFYPGHEYTMNGVNFAYSVNSEGDEVKNYWRNAEERLQKGFPAGPVTLGVEKQCNPYLRAKTLAEFKSLE